jgi:hypothetical protein
MKHTCRTYFRISGDFEPRELAALLGLRPHDMRRRGERYGRARRVAEESELTLGYNEHYEVNVNDMLRKTLTGIMDKADILRRMREEAGLSYALVIVPEIVRDTDEPTPILSLEADILAFLHISGATHDLDYYII